MSLPKYVKFLERLRVKLSIVIGIGSRQPICIFSVFDLMIINTFLARLEPAIASFCRELVLFDFLIIPGVPYFSGCGITDLSINQSQIKVSLRISGKMIRTNFKNSFP